MRNSRPFLGALFAGALLVGCSQSEEDIQRTKQPDPAPQIDADPTPQTGTGGESQTNNPDGTVNGVPVKREAPQPTP